MPAIVLDNFSNSNPPAETGYALVKIQVDTKGYPSTLECIQAGQVPDVSWEVPKDHKQVTFDIKSASVLTTGTKAIIKLKFAGVIKSWAMVGNDGSGGSGSAVITIKKYTPGNYPSIGSSIVASAKPTLTTQVENSSSTLTGWTTTFAVNDILEFIIDSVTSFKMIQLVLDVEVQ